MRMSPGATGYVVRVYRDTGELVDTVRTTETELRLPAGAHSFEVEAIDATGVIARSRRRSIDR